MSPARFCMDASYNCPLSSACNSGTRHRDHQGSKLSRDRWDFVGRRRSAAPLDVARLPPRCALVEALGVGLTTVIRACAEARRLGLIEGDGRRGRRASDRRRKRGRRALPARVGGLVSVEPRRSVEALLGSSDPLALHNISRAAARRLGARPGHVCWRCAVFLASTTVCWPPQVGNVRCPPSRARSSPPIATSLGRRCAARSEAGGRGTRARARTAPAGRVDRACHHEETRWSERMVDPR